jgi:hypothetical protein
VGWPADREQAEIAVVGNQGVDFVESAGQIKKQVRFSIEQLAPVQVASVDRSGDYGYITRGESWSVPVTLFDRDGHVSWRSGGTWPGVDDSVPGDFTGEGELSVATGFNGSGGITLFNGQGKQLWNKAEGNVWHIEALDTNGDGRDEIVHSNYRGQLLVRNARGQIIAQYLPGFYVSEFALTRWGEEGKADHILVPVTETRGDCCKPSIVILDAQGKKVADLDNRLGDLFDRFSGSPIRFEEGAEYFAVLENDYPKDRSMLLLYGQDGHIVYQEILGESCAGMAAYMKENGEKLLVGCAAKIWEYSEVPLIDRAINKNKLKTPDQK